MKIRAHRYRNWRPITTCADALAWLERHGYRETTDGFGDYRLFTEEADEIAGDYCCRTEADIIRLAAKLAAEK